MEKLFLVTKMENLGQYRVDRLCASNLKEYYDGDHDCYGNSFSIPDWEASDEQALEEAIRLHADVGSKDKIVILWH